MAKGIVLSVVLTVCWGVGQLLVFHLRRPRSYFKSMLVGFIFTIPVLVGTLFYAPADLGFLPEEWTRTSFPLIFVNTLIFHLLVFLTCILLFFHVERSITLRLLTEFAKASDRGLDLEDLKKLYNLEMMIGGRLEAMLENKYSRLEDGRHKLALRGRLVAHLFRISRKLLHLKRA